MRRCGYIERLGSSYPASTANESVREANSTERLRLFLSHRLRRMPLLIAIFGLLPYTITSEAASGRGRAFGWGRRREGAIVSSSNLFFAHLDRRQRPAGLAPWRDDQVRGRRSASFGSDRPKIRNAIAIEATRSRSWRKTHESKNSDFQDYKCAPILRKRV